MADNSHDPTHGPDDAAPDSVAVATYGVAGVRRDKNGVATVGRPPVAKLTEDGRAIVDANPTILTFDQLMEVLMVQNDAGFVTQILGHIIVKPTNLNTRINLTPEGEKAAE